jgi:hypothetical protein
LTLEQWNTRLADHFMLLRAERQASGSNLPLFALEHGLEQSELNELEAAVRAHAQRYPPKSEHALAWIVYATEIGYRFSGEEYWQTFEDETPGWAALGTREWLRSRFLVFHRKFGGAEPAGRWAQHFSIICWPITHAILPQDLQQQLAQALYDLRYRFSADLLKSPADLGDLIATHSWNRSSRFQSFAEETLLVGQIAAALLVQGEPAASALIHPAALQRIRHDLDRERRGRDWLREARQAARETVRITGLAIPQRIRVPPSRPDDARRDAKDLGIEPRLVLRPTDAARRSWQVLMEIPNLSHLLPAFPKFREILSGTRCTVTGARGGPLARGRCLFGQTRVELARWPSANDVLLKFERTDPSLDFLLRTECLLRAGPRWLFRIASDGLAYELRTFRVRSGASYILLGTDAELVRHVGSGVVSLGCEGVRGLRLDIPAAVTPEWQESLKALGLALASAIDVWPAGLAIAGWDGEGYGEWNSDEQPCIGIQADCALEGLSIALGSEPPLELPPIPGGEPVFIEIPRLAVGSHTIRVTARSVNADWDDIHGTLVIAVRAPDVQVGSPGLNPEGPLLVQIDPATPTLEQLWEGRLDVSVTGPVGRQVKCRVSLFERQGGVATVSHQLPPQALPISPGSWRSYFEVNFCDKADAASRYDSARACEIQFSADELGNLTTRCEREMVPLRWVPTRLGQSYTLRLIENVGNGSPLVSCFSFDKPAIRRQLEPSATYTVPSGGGLYEARLGGFSAAIVVPPTVRELSDLACNPLVDVQRSTGAVMQLVRLAHMWGNARLPGNLMSGLRQRTVLRALVAHMFAVLAGANWGESADKLQADGLAELGRTISRRHQSLGNALSAEVPLLARNTNDKRVSRFARVVGLHVGSTIELWIAEFALRLASQPMDLERWAGGAFEEAVQKVLDWQALTRAARFLVLALDQHATRARGELFAGWEWK